MSHPPMSPTRAAFLRGLLASAPFLFVITPFALLFGIIATEAGLNIVEVMGFSLAVFAGAAQFTAIQMMQENAPTLMILATSLAVNLRMSMYSASLTPHMGQLSLMQRAVLSFFLVDQSYAASMVEFEKRPQMSNSEKVAYFTGTFVLVAVPWYIATFVGALVGTQIPESWGLDFAMPLTFIALSSPMLRTPAHLVAAFVAVVLSLVFFKLPYSSGVLVAGIVAMLAGAFVEIWSERRA